MTALFNKHYYCDFSIAAIRNIRVVVMQQLLISCALHGFREAPAELPGRAEKYIEVMSRLWLLVSGEGQERADDHL